MGLCDLGCYNVGLGCVRCRTAGNLALQGARVSPTFAAHRGIARGAPGQPQLCLLLALGRISVDLPASTSRPSRSK